MPALSASELIAWWERSTGLHPVERAVTLLSAWLREPYDKTANLSIGRRDQQLGLLYESLFGPVLKAFAECPNCAEELEYSIPLPELQCEAAGQQEITLLCGETLLRLRLPDSFDLKAVCGCNDLQSAQKMLAQRCIVEARAGEAAIAVEKLTDHTLEKVAARLSESDPGAETLIDLTCSTCRQTWQVTLDIEFFVWTRINALAKRLLGEVHVLAQVYGWSESDILSLSPARRQFYLEMVQA